MRNLPHRNCISVLFLPLFLMFFLELLKIKIRHKQNISNYFELRAESLFFYNIHSHNMGLYTCFITLLLAYNEGSKYYDSIQLSFLQWVQFLNHK